MSVESFIAYASRSDLTEDEILTVVCLVDSVIWKFDGYDSEAEDERTAKRKQPGYVYTVPTDLLRQAADILAEETWILNFGYYAMDSYGRPIRTLEALRHLDWMTRFHMHAIEVEDIEPLTTWTKLQRVSLGKCGVRDLTPLRNCQMIHEFSILACEVDDLTVLAEWPSLSSLEIPLHLFPAFKALDRLAKIESLEFHWSKGGVDSFDSMPEMPMLRELRAWKVHGLEGLQCYPELTVLEGFGGDLPTLEPLRSLTNLTHVRFSSTAVSSVEPLAGLFALRDLRIGSTEEISDLALLGGLPVLHQLRVQRLPDERTDLPVPFELSPWDDEFRLDTPRYSPSLELDVVDREIFDHWNTRPYNLKPGERPLSRMLQSEMGWLKDRLHDRLSGDWRHEKDYLIPFMDAGGRSFTFVLLRDRMQKAFPQVVHVLQEELCLLANDWMIYLQDESCTWDVWVCPTKIRVATENARRVRNLIDPPFWRRFLPE